MPSNPTVIAALGATGAVIAALIAGWVANLSSRRQMRAELEKSQTTERANLLTLMAGQFTELRQETDSLRLRVRNTEKELTECVKKHLRAELALMRHGIDLSEPPGQS